MGIPSYFKYIITNYNSIFKKNKHIKIIHNLFIDSNSIVYDSIRELDITKYKIDEIERYEADLIRKVFEKMKFYIDVINPKKMVYIAFDGVVPYAKMEQQRQRRYKSWVLKNKENELERMFINNDDSDRNIKDVFSWDQTAITPGTEFMRKLNSYISNKIAEIENKTTLRILFSGSDEIGEGEHKLFEYIRKNNLKQEISCVYGLDSDLLMLSLNHLKFSKNIILTREKQDFNDELNDIYDNNELMFLDITEMRHNIICNMSNNTNKNYKNRDNIIDDYVLISFLLGNDFMPHFPALNIRIDGIDILFNHYKKCFKNGQTIINNGKINWKRFKSLIKSLSETEKDSIISNTEKMIEERNQICKKHKFKKIPYNSSIDDINKHIKQQLYNLNLEPTMNRDLEIFICPSTIFSDNNWVDRYYDTLFKFDYKEENIKEVCKNYLEGIEWCFTYYTDGCKDYKWRYNFHYPPLLYDLIKYIPIYNCNMLESNEKYELTNYNDYKKHITPLSLLCYVIPKSSFHLLSPELRKSILIKYGHNYENGHTIEYTYCKYLWEGHVEFPYINLDEFIIYVKNKK
tara:strand:+ start:2482 stop:4203 length:1722 start_codon:yes stop_codon:yes gene_type:complete